MPALNVVVELFVVPVALQLSTVNMYVIIAIESLSKVRWTMTQDCPVHQLKTCHVSSTSKWC